MVIGGVCIECAVIHIAAVGIADDTAGRLIAVYIHADPAVFHRARLEVADDAAGIRVRGYSSADTDILYYRLGAVYIAEQSGGIVALFDNELVYDKALPVECALEAVLLAVADGYPALAFIKRAVYNDAEVCCQEECCALGVVTLVYEVCEHFELLDIADAVAHALLCIRLRLIEGRHGHAVLIHRLLCGIAGVCLRGILSAGSLYRFSRCVKHPLAPFCAAVGGYPRVEKLQEVVARDRAHGFFLLGRAHGGARRKSHGVNAAAIIYAADVFIRAVIGIVHIAYLGIRDLSGYRADIAGAADLGIVCTVNYLSA